MKTPQPELKLSTIEEAIAAVRRGELVVVLDDEDRENEGDLIMAAEKATPESIAFMVRHTSGLICVSVEGERLDELQLPMMVATNTEQHRTAFTVSVDYRLGTTTGISASDRSATIRALADPAVDASQLARPGHVFPLRAHPLGVLGRPGHTEAAVDLARLAGLQPSGALCEIVGDDGEPARGEALLRFARAHALPAITIADLVAHRRRTEQLVDLLASARLPTRHGEFTIHTFRSRLDGIEHVALVRGAWSEHEPVLARIHSECLTGDVFGSARCDCGSQLELALERVAEAGAGVVVYVRGHEGRGIGLTSKLHAYQLQDDGRDTVQANEDLGLPADARSYTEAAHILRALGAHQVRLLTNNPRKVGALQLLGVSVLERVPLHAAVTAESRAYLRAKRDKLGHLLHPAPLLEPA